MWKDKLREEFVDEYLKPDMCNRPYVVADWFIARMEEREEEIRKEYTIMGKSTD